MEKLRVFFSKTGNARFISHLDLMRTMARAVNRAGIKIKYSQGFNPHPHIVFGNPLSLGYESTCEFCDVELAEGLSAEEVEKRLSAAMPEGLTVTKVTAPVSDPAEIAFSSYQLTFQAERPLEEAALVKIREAFSAEELLLDKKSKSGVKRVNLLPLIEKLEFQPDNGVLKADATLPSGNVISVNPSLILDALSLVLPEYGRMRMPKVLRYELLDKNKHSFA